jgi:xylose dehydrogenase (NAD/NADP)
MARLAMGILGTGHIAGVFAEGLNHSERWTLAAVGSRSADSARAFAAKFGAKTTHGSYQALLDDPVIHAVYNSLPNSLHHEWTIKALRAGKHVLCEKPIAVNLGQAQEMFDEARRAGKILVEAFMYRSHPMTHALQRAVREGQIGELKMIRSSFVFSAQSQGNVRFDTSLAGGSLMDIGCYCISYSRLFAGKEPAAMTAYGHLHASGVDDYAAGALAFPGGILANFICGMTARSDNAATLHGSDGYIEIPIPWKPPVKDAEFTRVDAAGQRHTTRVSAGKHLYALEADDFAAAILNGTPVAVSEADSIGNQRCLDALRKQIGLSY